MNDRDLPYPYSIMRHGVSLSNCDDEPVQTPGCIQAHGLLLALRPHDLAVMQVSENWAAWTGCALASVLGQPLVHAVGHAAAQRIADIVRTESLDCNPVYALSAPLHGQGGAAGPLDFCVHRSDGVVIVELEPASARIAGDSASTGDSNSAGATAAAPVGDAAYYGMVKTTLVRLKAAQSLAEFCAIAAREVRRTLQLDRVMVYRFHADDTGEVVADSHRDGLESWLGLRYPASDIPKPAREIFKRIGVRPLPDANGALSEIVPLLNPDTGRPLDMTYCALRGASVMYTDYLRNMGVAATMTMPILRDGALWGLIACHHYTPIALPFPLRAAAEFLGQITSLEIASAEKREHLEYRLRLEAAHLAVLTQALADGNFGALTPGLLDGIDAGGVAVLENGRWATSGITPTVAQLDGLAASLGERFAGLSDGRAVVALHTLQAEFPAAAAYAASASGVLAFPLTQRAGGDWVMWFRPEQVQTFKWGGNPYEKPTSTGPHGPRLTPRLSFDIWQEEVRGRAAPWLPVEVEAAKNLRLLLLDIVVARAQQLAALNLDLVRSNEELDAFAYVAGHDLKEPLRGIHKYAHMLMEDALAGKAPDAAARERIAALLRLTVRMDGLLDALLHFSRVGRLSLERETVALDAVVGDAIDMLGARLIDSGIVLRIPRLMPTVSCDRIRVREVFANLIANAVKYNDMAQRWVEIGALAAADLPPGAAPAVRLGAGPVLYVRDNGIGIEERHRERVFMMFKRLHARDAYGGGSGAGLAITKKLVEQHQGHVWFDSVPGAGTTFYFSLSGPDAIAADE